MRAALQQHARAALLALAGAGQLTLDALMALWGATGFAVGFLVGRIVMIALWWWLAALRGYKAGL